MIMEYGSWVLAVIGVGGIYFVGRKTVWGWLVLLFNEVLGFYRHEFSPGVDNESSRSFCRLYVY